jgi:RNA polymerase sigma-70 factor, ECF subfamily
LDSAGQSVTQLLRQFAGGDKAAFDRLAPMVYDELRRIAMGQLRRERPEHTLQPTALVHEAYMRMVHQDQPDYRNRAHFLAIAAQLMRKILIDHARGRNAAKRGGGEAPFTIDEARDSAVERPWIILALEDALTGLERHSPVKARLIELRFFGGLTAEESAEVMNMEVVAVRRELRVAQAWLERELASNPATAGKS